MGKGEDPNCDGQGGVDMSGRGAAAAGAVVGAGAGAAGRVLQKQGQRPSRPSGGNIGYKTGNLVANGAFWAGSNLIGLAVGVGSGVNRKFHNTLLNRYGMERSERRFVMGMALAAPLTLLAGPIGLGVAGALMVPHLFKMERKKRYDMRQAELQAQYSEELYNQRIAEQQQQGYGPQAAAGDQERRERLKAQLENMHPEAQAVIANSPELQELIMRQQDLAVGLRNKFEEHRQREQQLELEEESLKENAEQIDQVMLALIKERNPELHAEIIEQRKAARTEASEQKADAEEEAKQAQAEAREAARQEKAKAKAEKEAAERKVAAEVRAQQKAQTDRKKEAAQVLVKDIRDNLKKQRADRKTVTAPLDNDVAESIFENTGSVIVRQGALDSKISSGDQMNILSKGDNGGIIGYCEVGQIISADSPEALAEKVKDIPGIDSSAVQADASKVTHKGAGGNKVTVVIPKTRNRLDHPIGRDELKQMGIRASQIVYHDNKDNDFMGTLEQRQALTIAARAGAENLAAEAKSETKTQPAKKPAAKKTVKKKEKLPEQQEERSYEAPQVSEEGQASADFIASVANGQTTV